MNSPTNAEVNGKAVAPTHRHAYTPTPRTPLINAAAVRQRALDIAAATRGKRFTRVSRQFLQDCDRRMDEYIRNRIHSTPSLGQTL